MPDSNKMNDRPADTVSTGATEADEQAMLHQIGADGGAAASARIGAAPRRPSTAGILDTIKFGADEKQLDRELEEAMGGARPEMPSDAAMNLATAEPQSDAILSGRIANIGSQDVLIDFGGKSLGAMPLSDFEKDERYAIGDPIEVMVVDGEPRGGLITVSRRKARQAAILRALKPGDVLKGHVRGMNKGGLEVDIDGLRGFIPASQVDLHFMKDISNLIGKDVHAEVVKFDTDSQDIVLSRRNYQLREAELKKKELFGELEVGQVRKGVVRGLAEFGAFIDLGGVDALLHISDMSWGRVNKPEEIVKVGDHLEARIIKINKEKKKVSLSLKELKPNPWQTAGERYSVGMKLSGRVVRMQNFGAFIEIEPGLEGLLPVSELSWTRRVRNPSEVVKEGDVIEVAIIGLDLEKKRLSLSLRQTAPDPWSVAVEKYQPGTMVKGKVARVTDFGAFVALEDGIDGLLHISELSDQRVKAVTDKVKPGDEVEVRVLGVDTENKRISLSMKKPPPEPTPEEKAERERQRAAVQKAQQKKREKRESRRGGITIGWDEGLAALDPSKFAR